MYIEGDIRSGSYVLKDRNGNNKLLRLKQSGLDGVNEWYVKYLTLNPFIFNNFHIMGGNGRW